MCHSKLSAEAALDSENISAESNAEGKAGM